MDINDLLKLLEIDTVSDFEYFEHVAEIVESDEDIPFETYYELFRDVNHDTLAELIESYFEDTLKYIPDEHIDFYTLLSNIGQTLFALASSLDVEDNFDQFVDEFYKFRNWFRFDSEVECIRKSNGSVVEVPISEALAIYRLENLNEEEYEYNFDEVMDYPLDEYIVPLDSLLDSEDDYSDEEYSDDY